MNARRRFDVGTGGRKYHDTAHTSHLKDDLLLMISRGYAKRYHAS